MLFRSGVIFGFTAYGKENSYIDVKNAKADSMADARFGAERTAQLAAKYNLTIGVDISKCEGIINFSHDLKTEMDNGFLRVDQMTVVFHGKDFDMSVTFTKGEEMLSFAINNLVTGLNVSGKTDDVKNALAAAFKLKEIALTGNNGKEFDLKSVEGVEGFLSAVIKNGLEKFGLTEMIFDFTRVAGFQGLQYGFIKGANGFTALYSFALAGARFGHSGFAPDAATMKKSFAEMAKLKAEVSRLLKSAGLDVLKANNTAVLGKLSSTIFSDMLLGDLDKVASESERVSGGEFTLILQDGNGKPIIEFTFFRKGTSGNQIGIKSSVFLVDKNGYESRFSFGLMSDVSAMTENPSSIKAVKDASAKLMAGLSGTASTAIDKAKTTSLTDPKAAGAFMDQFLCPAIGKLLTDNKYQLTGGEFSLTLIKTTGLDAEILHYTPILSAGTVTGWNFDITVQLNYFSKAASGDRQIKQTLRIPAGSSEDAFRMVEGLRKLDARGDDAKFLTSKLLLNLVNSDKALAPDATSSLRQDILKAIFGNLLVPDGAPLISIYGVVIRQNPRMGADKTVIPGGFTMLEISGDKASGCKLTDLSDTGK